MTLGFSTQINGKPNYFPQKIIKGLPIALWNKSACLSYFWDSSLAPYLSLIEYEKLIPKITTIRKDTYNRWHGGINIHMVINNRTKNRFQFAPVVKCRRTQKIEIIHTRGYACVNIDDKFFGEIYHFGFDDIHEYTNDLGRLAWNDGFNSVEDFFAYFNKDFKGKIIHWTDLKY